MILCMIFLIFPKGVDGRLLRKIMAESAESTIDKELERLNVSREKEKIILKREQETAVKELLAGRDVMAILPTGFGKSLIFTVFAIAKEQLRSEKTCVISRGFAARGGSAANSHSTGTQYRQLCRLYIMFQHTSSEVINC